MTSKNRSYKTVKKIEIDLVMYVVDKTDEITKTAYGGRQISSENQAEHLKKQYKMRKKKIVRHENPLRRVS